MSDTPITKSHAARSDAARNDAARNEAAKKYAAVFLGSEAGRWVLGDVLAKFPVDRTSFDLARPDPLLAAIKDGQRSVSMDIESAVRLGAKLAGIPYERP